MNWNTCRQLTNHGEGGRNCCCSWDDSADGVSTASCLIWGANEEKILKRQLLYYVVVLPGADDDGLCLPKKSATDPFPPVFCVYIIQVHTSGTVSLLYLLDWLGSGWITRGRKWNGGWLLVHSLSFINILRSVHILAVGSSIDTLH